MTLYDLALDPRALRPSHAPAETAIARRAPDARCARAVQAALTVDPTLLDELERDAERFAADPDALGAIAPPPAPEARPLGAWITPLLAPSETADDNLRGEALAIGIALEVRYLVLCGRLRRGEDERIWDLLTRMGYQLWSDALLKLGRDGRPGVLRRLDAARAASPLGFTQLDGLGRPSVTREIDAAKMRAAADWLRVSAGR